MVGLVKMFFNVMLNLGLSFLRVLEAHKIYTEFVPWYSVRNYHSFDFTLYIDSCLFLASLSDGIIFT